MPIFHFNVHDGVSPPDLDGTELVNLTAARVDAVRLAGAVLQDDAVAFWTREDWSLDVTDERGLILFTLLVLANDAPCIVPTSG